MVNDSLNICFITKKIIPALFFLNNKGNIRLHSEKTLPKRKILEEMEAFHFPVDKSSAKYMADELL